MNILPVASIIAAAYRFVGRELATVLRLTWAPFLLAALIQFALTHYAVSALERHLANPASAAIPFLASYRPWLTVRMCADVIAASVAAVALHRLILFGDRQEGRWLVLSFGRDARIFALLGIAFSAFGLAFIFVIDPSNGRTSGLMPLVVIAGAIAALYLSVRLWPIFPIIVAERRADFSAAWALTRGRTWSLLALWIFGALPLIVLALLPYLVLPDMDAAISSASWGYGNAADLRAVGDMLLLRMVTDFVASVVYTAVVVALISFTYRALRLPASERSPVQD